MFNNVTNRRMSNIVFTSINGLILGNGQSAIAFKKTEFIQELNRDNIRHINTLCETPMRIFC